MRLFLLEILLKLLGDFGELYEAENKCNLSPGLIDSAVTENLAWQSGFILFNSSHGKGQRAQPYKSIKQTKGVACIREISAMCFPKANIQVSDMVSY